eukprot:4816314-Pyramimonas_sp.AAC.1
MLWPWRFWEWKSLQGDRFDIVNFGVAFEPPRDDSIGFPPFGRLALWSHGVRDRRCRRPCSMESECTALRPLSC